MNKFWVSGSALQAALLAALRVVITLLAGWATLFGLLKAQDLEGIFAFLQSNEGLVFLTAIVTVITFATSMYLTVVKHRQLIAAADAAPNSVAEVK